MHWEGTLEPLVGNPPEQPLLPPLLPPSSEGPRRPDLVGGGDEEVDSGEWGC